MSVLNTSNQRIPDGYATIRRSSVLRSRNTILKGSQSVPKINRSTSDLSTAISSGQDEENNLMLTQLDSINNENNNNDYFRSPRAPSSFKQPITTTTTTFDDDDIDLDEELNKAYANLNETNGGISCYNYSLPPLKSPQYITKLNSFRSHKPKSQDLSLYVRPKSPNLHENDSFSMEPLYQNVPASPIYANFNTFRMPLQPPPPPPPRDYQNLTKLKTFHSLYDESVKRKPPINNKSATLQHRSTTTTTNTFQAYNTIDHSSNNIYAEPMIPLANSTNIGSSEFSDISSDGYTSKIGRRSASDIVSLDFGPTSTKKRYATYGHQKKGEEKHLIAGKSTGSLNESQLDYFDVMSCKVGCQDRVRTKPKVPWYELAIKKDNRQSCPPLYETEVFN